MTVRWKDQFDYGNLPDRMIPGVEPEYPPMVIFKTEETGFLSFVDSGSFIFYPKGGQQVIEKCNALRIHFMITQQPKTARVTAHPGRPGFDEIILDFMRGAYVVCISHVDGIVRVMVIHLLGDLDGLVSIRGPVGYNGYRDIIDLRAAIFLQRIDSCVRRNVCGVSMIRQKTAPQII